MADQSAERAVMCLDQLCGKDWKIRCLFFENVGFNDDNEFKVESVGERCVKLFVSLHRKRDQAPVRRKAMQVSDRFLRD
jgi:hypothetical protein